MILLSNYQSMRTLSEGVSTVIYRGYRKVDQQPVILKIIKAEYPHLRELARLRHEYELASSLTIGGVVRPLMLEQQGHRLVLVLEDFGGQALHEVIGAQGLEAGAGIGDWDIIG